MASRILDRLLVAWLREYAVLTRNLDLIRAFPSHQWFWDGFEHVDPVKEARVQETRLNNHTTTLAHEYSRHGHDGEVELRQRAKDVALMRGLGLNNPDQSNSRPRRVIR